MKQLKIYSMIAFLILIIFANLLSINREGLTFKTPTVPTPPQTSLVPSISSQTTSFPAVLPNLSPPISFNVSTIPSSSTNVSSVNVSNVSSVYKPPSTNVSSLVVSSTNSSYLNPLLYDVSRNNTSSVQPSNTTSTINYSMVCANDADCDKYPSDQYNFKGSFTNNGITISKDKTYYCKDGVCRKY